MYTLHHAAEIRTIDQIDELREVRGKVKPDEMKLAQQVIDSFEAPLDLTTYKDEYQEGLRQIIDAKIAGEEVVAHRGQEAPPKVVDLMEALRRASTRSARRRRRQGQGERRRRSRQQGRQDGSGRRPSRRSGRRRSARRGAQGRLRRTARGSSAQQQPARPRPDAVGSRSQSGGASQTNARMAITQRS